MVKDKEQSDLQFACPAGYVGQNFSVIQKTEGFGSRVKVAASPGPQQPPMSDFKPIVWIGDNIANLGQDDCHLWFACKKQGENCWSVALFVSAHSLW